MEKYHSPTPFLYTYFNDGSHIFNDTVEKLKNLNDNYKNKKVSVWIMDYPNRYENIKFSCKETSNKLNKFCFLSNLNIVVSAYYDDMSCNLNFDIK